MRTSATTWAWRSSVSEVVNVREMPVYCTPSMAQLLRENGPWKRSSLLGNIAIHEIELTENSR